MLFWKFFLVCVQKLQSNFFQRIHCIFVMKIALFSIKIWQPDKKNAATKKTSMKRGIVKWNWLYAHYFFCFSVPGREKFLVLVKKISKVNNNLSNVCNWMHQLGFGGMIFVFLEILNFELIIRLWHSTIWSFLFCIIVDKSEWQSICGVHPIISCFFWADFATETDDFKANFKYLGNNQRD